MPGTLVYTDTIYRIGYTVIDGVKVVQHTCTLPLNNPQEMRISMTKLDAALYKEHRDICRTDFAMFEDAAYQLQEEYTNNLND